MTLHHLHTATYSLLCRQLRIVEEDERRQEVRESLDDMYLANDCIKAAMEMAGIAEKRGLYSPNLMKTQIKAIDDLLMGREYFGE